MRLLTAGVLVALGCGSASAQMGPSPLSWSSPQIAIVWPQDGQGHQASVAQSRAVNVSVWDTDPVRCGPPVNPPALYVARDNEPAEVLGHSTELVSRPRPGGGIFLSYEFNNIPADIADQPGTRYTFLAGNIEGGITSNVWVEGVDPRTYDPTPVVPTGFSSGSVQDLQNLDVRIQIVWPHDAAGQPADEAHATRVNIAVDVFQHGTLLSVPLAFPRPTDNVTRIDLGIAQGDQPVRFPDYSSPAAAAAAPVAQKIPYRVGNQTYPRWVFNDVPVQPGVQYHFLVLLSDTRLAPHQHSTIWTYGRAASTAPMAPVTPPPCVADR